MLTAFQQKKRQRDVRILKLYREGEKLERIAIICDCVPSLISQLAQKAGLRRHAKRGTL